jgi:hypothetical protein
MTVLKWLLIIFGVVFLAAVAALVGGYYWASTVESVRLTAADLEIGGSYPPAERQALLGACEKSVQGSKTDANACTCIADKAGLEFSRFERLALTAGLEGSPTKIVALTKGLIGGGIAQDKVEAMEKGSKERIDGLLKTCGLEHK